MSSHKDHSHLEQIKEAVTHSELLSESEKSQTMQHIDEWILEDKAEGMLYQELIELVNGIKPLLAELGLIK
ncbi:MAG: hypothetical protein PF439_08035 [Helicobacteraceae bacterium]|jgi:hypothetical protein|nr:hypothetical protein [Helicobacteraceae bacterium]